MTQAKELTFHSPEWAAFAKVELALYEEQMAQEMAAYRPACLRPSTQEEPA